MWEMIIGDVHITFTNNQLHVDDRILPNLDVELVNVQEEEPSWNDGYMIGAIVLSITWGDTPEYWEWKTLPESSCGEVAELFVVWWLDIREGDVNYVFDRWERVDRWLEMEMGEFGSNQGEDGEVEMILMEMENSPKAGLVEQGIEIRPKRA
ncbi:hypothetical protein GIB67_003412 [Kingdonia uniflora]|uniref:Uncharacterized protein n=1 Tax=Kingdonia uniflora TaxID=39325 RepID=A0A7J7P9V2_9MAGN|nr:hypothetical protein GIB67_003412 [Kingdonia uniflora]